MYIGTFKSVLGGGPASYDILGPLTNPIHYEHSTRNKKSFHTRWYSEFQ